MKVPVLGSIPKGTKQDLEDIMVTCASLIALASRLLEDLTCL